MTAFDRLHKLANALSEIETLEASVGAPVFDWTGKRKAPPLSACLHCALAWIADGSDPGRCGKCGHRAIVLLDPEGS